MALNINIPGNQRECHNVPLVKVHHRELAFGQVLSVLVDNQEPQVFSLPAEVLVSGVVTHKWKQLEVKATDEVAEADNVNRGIGQH